MARTDRRMLLYRLRAQSYPVLLFLVGLAAAWPGRGAGSPPLVPEGAVPGLYIPAFVQSCVPFLPETIPSVVNGSCDQQLEYFWDRCWNQAAWDELVGPERAVTVSLGRVTYFDFGTLEAPPLLLLPGMGTTKTSWDPAFLRDLSPWFRLIAPNYPGMGTASIDDYDEFSVENLASVVWELVEALQLERPHLLGFAFSGKIAGLVFADHGEELGRYVDVAGRIYNSSGRTVSDDLLEQLTSPDPLDVALAAWPENACGLANLLAVGERELSHTQEPRTPEALEASRRAQKAWQEEGDSLDLHAIRNPTLIIAGDVDDVTPLEDMSMAAAVLRSGTMAADSSSSHDNLRHYPWASHTVIYQYRPWVVREVVRFLRFDPPPPVELLYRSPLAADRQPRPE